jgi:hypothetical protein
MTPVGEGWLSVLVPAVNAQGEIVRHAAPWRLYRLDQTPAP